VKKEVANKMERRSLAQVEDYREAFGTPAGSRVVHDLMRVHNVMGCTFVEGDPYKSALLEGERRVVLRILKVLRTDPKGLIERIKEGEKQYE
jgi:hypothetical protein